MFKEPLECPTLRGGPILSTEDVKGIFGNITDIMDVHKKIQVRALILKVTHLCMHYLKFVSLYSLGIFRRESISVE